LLTPGWLALASLSTPGPAQARLGVLAAMSVEWRSVCRDLAGTTPVANIRVVSCQGVSHPGLTDLLQLSSVVNLLLWFTASGAHRCIVLMTLDFRPTAAGGCDLL
jgi:hypothetical protein